MNTATRVAAAAASGYILGRRKRLKLAIAVGSMLAGKRLATDPKGMLRQANELIESRPELAKISDQVRTTLFTAARGAAVGVVSNRINSLSDSIRDRSDKLTGAVTDKVPIGGGNDDEEQAGEETEEETEERSGSRSDDEEKSEDRDESRGSRRSRRSRREDDGDSGSEESSERSRPRKRPAKKAPAKKAASSGGDAPARKQTAKKTTAKKTTAKKSAAKKSASSGRSRTGSRG